MRLTNEIHRAVKHLNANAPVSSKIDDAQIEVCVTQTIADLENSNFDFSAYSSIILKQRTKKRRVKQYGLFSTENILCQYIMLYSHYYQPFFEAMRQQVENIVGDRIDKISPYEQMLQDEFWYVLIFHNCPLLSVDCLSKIQNVINRLRFDAVSNPNDYPNKKLVVMICDFLDSQEGFFNWNNSTRISEALTYRTFQRTLFKRYKGSRYGMYASIE